MRGGVHPETPLVPFALGWDLVGAVASATDLRGGIAIFDDQRRVHDSQLRTSSF